MYILIFIYLATCPEKPTLNRARSRSPFNVSPYVEDFKAGCIRKKGASSGTARVHEAAFSKKEISKILFSLQNPEAPRSLAISKLASGSTQSAIKIFASIVYTASVLIHPASKSCPIFTLPTVSKIPIPKKVSLHKCAVSSNHNLLSKTSFCCLQLLHLNVQKPPCLDFLFLKLLSFYFIL